MTLLSRPQRVITYVLSDLVERKNPAFPVVHVSHTPDENEVRPLTKSEVKRAVVDVLAEGTGSIFYTTRRSLAEAKQATRAELSKLGYTVHSSGPRRLYVIEYSSPFRGDHENTWLYVGETGIDVEERVQQHFSGTKAAKYWQHLARHRPDLEPKEQYWSVEDSTEAEQNLGRALEESGYRVRGPKGFGKPSK